MINDENSRLRKLERELYTTDIVPPKRRSVLHEEPDTVPDDWNEKVARKQLATKKQGASSFFKNVFKASAAFFVVACIVLGVSMLTGGNTISGKNVDITITSKSFVDGGELLPVTVSVANQNKVAMELVTLTLEYPEGSDVDGGARARIVRDIGSIDVGATKSETFTLQLYGQEGSQKSLTASVEFRVPGSNAVYDTDKTASVVVRTSPVRLTLEAPEQVTPNQEVPLVFTVVGNGTATLPNTALILEYPQGFTFTKADPAPSTEKRVWYLGDLPPGANRTITVYGTLSGGVNDLKTIRASVGAQNPRNELALDTTYNSLSQVISMTNAFLATSLRVQNQDAETVSVPASDGANVSLAWSNTLPAQLSNVEIRVGLSGSGYDPSLVQPGNGFFDSTNNQVVWTRQQVPQLALVQPGASGSLGFAFGLKSAGVTNSTVTLSVNISGIQSGGDRLEAKNVESKRVVLGSDANILTKGIHYAGQIQNSGPMPPVANKETTYTVEWQLTNSRNKMTNARVTTILPVNVSWKDVVIPQTELANVTYNTVTREIVWNAGDLPASGGGSAPVKTLSFKVGLVPSTAQVGSRPDLTGETRFTARDSFTGTDVSVTKRGPTTSILNDLSNVGTDGKVVAQ